MQLDKKKALTLYIQALLFSYVMIGGLATIQHLFVYGALYLKYYFIPFLAATVLGLLLGTMLWLRHGLKEQRKLFKQVADSALEFSYVRALNGGYRYVSPAARTLTGFDPEDFYAKPNFLDGLIHEDDAERWQEHLQRIVREPGPDELTLRIRSRDGSIRWMRHLCGPVHDEQGRHVAVRSTNIDVTEAMELQARMGRMVDYDPLTALPNRRYITRHLQTLVEEAAARDEQFYVLFLDLDRFKFVNDAHGHAVGDGLLCELADRLRKCCRDEALFSRFGGDEFLIVTPPGADAGQLDRMVQRLLALVEEPFRVDGMQFRIGGSIGAATFPRDGRDPEVLIKNADAAMYRAKRTGLDFQFFSPDISQDVADTVWLETRLREAVAAGELLPYYQPVIDLSSGAVVGAEALARWPQPDGSFISPATFISLAEETGRIHQLGSDILRHACRDLLAWRAQGVDLYVSVNVSARQFQDPAFCDRITALLRESNCDPAFIELELTESALLEEIEASRQKLETLRTLGVRISLDDFGTGFSSLGYLAQLPIDTLKLDRSFILNMAEDKRQRAVVQGILALGRNLGVRVVAEGIEHAWQAKSLQTMGCKLGQGFYFEPALSAGEYLDYLRSRAALVSN